MTHKVLETLEAEILEEDGRPKVLLRYGATMKVSTLLQIAIALLKSTHDRIGIEVPIDDEQIPN